jgi:hypothetical protein
VSYNQGIVAKGSGKVFTGVWAGSTVAGGVLGARVENDPDQSRLSAVATWAVAGTFTGLFAATASAALVRAPILRCTRAGLLDGLVAQHAIESSMDAARKTQRIAAVRVDLERYAQILEQPSTRRGDVQRNVLESLRGRGLDHVDTARRALDEGKVYQSPLWHAMSKIEAQAEIFTANSDFETLRARIPETVPDELRSLQENINALSAKIEWQYRKGTFPYPDRTDLGILRTKVEVLESLMPAAPEGGV